MALLRRAGWHSARLVDLAPFEQWLRSEAIPIDAKALEILRRIGGLEVEHLDAEGRWDFFRLHPQPGRIYRPGSFLEQNEELFEIGEAHIGFVKLLMGPSGRVFGEVEGSVVRLGMDGFQALETLCQGKVDWRSLMHKRRRAD